MRLETRILYSLREPHNGLGASQARPRAFSRRVAPKARSGKAAGGWGPSRLERRSGAGLRGPRERRAGGPRGRSPGRRPPDLLRSGGLAWVRLKPDTTYNAIR